MSRRAPGSDPDLDDLENQSRWLAERYDAETMPKLNPAQTWMHRSSPQHTALCWRDLSRLMYGLQRYSTPGNAGVCLLVLQPPSC
jgi:hypothetical protein